MSTQIKYAYKRHNTWVYRRTYPKHLQEYLGSSLKQSLKTADAKTAKARVAELNQTFTKIVKEAEAHVSAHHSHPAASEQGASRSDSYDTAEPRTDGALRPAVKRPRYPRPRLLGDRRLAELAGEYLAIQTERLRPGSYKAVRFALGLLTSHVGGVQSMDITPQVGREILGYVSKLSPNARKYRDGKQASLQELVKLSQKVEPDSTLTPQTQSRILKHMQQFLDWCVQEGELEANPWAHLRVRDRPDVTPHQVLTDEQVVTLLKAKDRVLSGALLFGLLTGMRSGEICGLMAEDVIAKGNLGRFIHIRPNAIRQLKSKAAEREVPLHDKIEQLLDTSLPKQGRLFPDLTVDRVVKAYANLRQRHPELHGTVFHSTRKWFITQCERTGVPEHYTASLVGHHSARSANKLTYGLYSAGITDEQKRGIVDGVRLPQA